MKVMYHKSVLLKPSIDALVTNPDGIFVDCTFGGGGHSNEILKRLSDKGKLYAFDQDADALLNTLSDPRFTLIPQNFRFLQNFLRFYGIEKIDGIMADFGVSSHQFDTAERGFSTRFEGNLDMRMNKMQPISAQTILNDYSEEQLSEIIFKYGELREAKRLAREIVQYRKEKHINTTIEFKEIFNYIPKKIENKFFAQLFQAIRIEVNQELAVIEEMLLQSKLILKNEGRLVIISYHSLEDRLVKKFLKTGLFEGEPTKDIFGNWHKPFKELSSKAIVPNEIEINENPRARSAKMRVGIRNNN